MARPAEGTTGEWLNLGLRRDVAKLIIALMVEPSIE